MYHPNLIIQYADLIDTAEKHGVEVKVTSKYITVKQIKFPNIYDEDIYESLYKLINYWCFNL
jgi:hypothetical protein